MVERSAHNGKEVGSIPTRPTILSGTFLSDILSTFLSHFFLGNSIKELQKKRANNLITHS